MKVTNIEPIIEKIRNTVSSHCIDEGQYSRWIWQNEENNRDLGINEYGCADAANILYTIGDFPSDNSEREKWISAMQNMQNPETGMFNEATHQVLHTTAHCIAALELFDAKPKYEVTKEYKSVESLYKLLDNLDWKNHPWTESHNGAGIYVIMNLTDNVDEKWKEYGVVICLENMPMREFSLATPDKILDIVNEINDDNFKICLDTGHVAAFKELSVGDEVRKLGNKIETFHIHDNFPDNDLHLMPYFGVIDWKDFIESLKEINYKGVFSLETLPSRKLSTPIFEELSIALAKLARELI